jgi:prepilin-type N-terminal cleavage/methylation domain-containing protein
MKTNRGFTLVELLVALGIFAIVSASITALMTSGLRTRQASQRTLNAQQVAYAVIEDHKNFWTVKDNYAVKTGATNQTLLPNWNTASYLQNVGVEVANVAISYGCLDADGTSRTNTAAPTAITTQADALNCSVAEPALRSVKVTIKDRQGRVTADLTSEIGKPVAARR